jgi:hypothetical protein
VTDVELFQALAPTDAEDSKLGAAPTG